MVKGEVYMRLEQLQYFLEIAHTKSISIAAEHLYVTQPALSRAIKALEDELGVILFTRTVEGAFLTKEGEILLPESLEILQKTELLQNHAAQLSSPIQYKPVTKLHILTLSTLADTLFVPAITQLQQKHPDAMITVSNLKLNSFSEHLDFSDYDMIVVTDIADLLQPLFANLQFYQEELFFENYFAVVHHQHALAMKKSISFAEAFAYKVIMPQNGLPMNALLDKLVPEQKNPQLFMQSNNARITTAALCQQQAVLITTGAIIQQDYLKNPELTMVPIKEIHGNCFALYDPEHPYSHLLRALLINLKASRLTI